MNSSLPYRTITEAMAAANPDQPFITMWYGEDEIRTVTFGEFLERARIQATEFVAEGVESGDSIVLIMPQGIPLMTAFAAAMLIGAVPSIMAYPNFKVDAAKYRSGLAGVAENLNARIVLLDEEFPDDLLEHVRTGNRSRIVKNPSGYELKARAALPDVSIESTNTAFIQHSAGTTGLQKGVALSHAAVLRQLDHLASAVHLNHNDRIYSWLPLYHDMGLIACFMLPLVYHLPVVMQSPDGWVLQPGAMLSLITDYNCTLTWVPNFALQFLARRVRPAERTTFDLSSLRLVVNCSEPVRAQSMDEFYAMYASCNLKQESLQTSYAMAENVFAVTQSEVDGETMPCRLWIDGRKLIEQHIAQVVEADQVDRICMVSSGKCLAGVHIRIVSGECLDLSEGHVGEVVIQSDCLFDGYHSRPDLNAKALQQGWYHSNDLGFLHDGQLYVIGRKNDLIIVAGKNIYPQDIEEIACSDARIHDGRAVAIGIFNPNLGTEEIVVVAEIEDGTDIQDAVSIERSIRGAVVAELGVAVRAVYVKPPKWIVKSTAGKPARSATRQKLLAEQSELNGA